MTLTTAYSQNRHIAAEKVNDSARVMQTYERPLDKELKRSKYSRAAVVRKRISEIKKLIIKVQFEKEIKSEQYSTTDTLANCNKWQKTTSNNQSP